MDYHKEVCRSDYHKLNRLKYAVEEYCDALKKLQAKCNESVALSEKTLKCLYELSKPDK